MQKPRTWALVADGVRARIIRGLEEPVPRTEPEPELVSRSRLRHLQDMISDRPGRTQSSDRSGRRSGLAPHSDPIRSDMRDFARDLTDRLDSHRRAGDFERLAIFAAPAMLGLLRDEMPRGLRGTVVLERSQNLVQLAEAELHEVVKREIDNLGKDVSA